jgi:acyl-CoA synthetase (AMP-forming)/AMP-acid ligase II
MLYERWQEVARAQAGELALFDVAAARRWTFRELEESAERLSNAKIDVIYPCGASVDFLAAVLSAWRFRRVCCPLEVGQPGINLTCWPEEMAQVKVTSATTGRPRLVAFTAGQLAADAQNIVATMGLRPEWPNLGVISLAHSYGFSNLVTPLLLHGIPLVVVPAPLPETVRRAASDFPGVTLPAVPALWRAWDEAGAIPANVRLAISAGAPLPLSVERNIFERSGLKIHNFYGATECGGIAYDSNDSPRMDGSYVGRAMKNVTLSPNADGCLEVRGPAVGETYWPEPEPGLAGGCYRTSDLVELRDGCVFLRGRAGDLINVAGRKLSPEIIEQTLLAHEAVRDCLVFGAPDPDAKRGDIIVACLVSRSPVKEDQLKQYLLERLPAWQVPREWRFVDSLAPNARGKLSRAEWREKLGFARG